MAAADTGRPEPSNSRPARMPVSSGSLPGWANGSPAVEVPPPIAADGALRGALAGSAQNGSLDGLRLGTLAGGDFLGTEVQPARPTTISKASRVAPRTLWYPRRV